MIQFFKSFLRYYTTSQAVEITSHYDAARSLSRILELDGRGDIRVWRARGETVMACGAQWGRSNAQPIFEGRFEECAGRVALRGRVGIDPGIRIVLGSFWFVIFVFFPLSWAMGGTQVPSGRQYIVVPACFVGLLLFFYLAGRNDPAKILRNLERALDESDGT